jgi:kumamolisin
MTELVGLEGSERSIPQGAQDRGKVQDDAQLSVTVYLRPDPAAERPFDVEEEAGKRPSERRYLSAVDAAKAFGAASEEIDAVEAFAASHGLTVERVNQAARSVKLSGSAAALSGAFGVELRSFTHEGVTYHSHTGAVQLPAELAPIVQAVLGLDNRPLGRKFLRLADDEHQAAIRAHGGLTLPPNTFLPPQVAALYSFPDASAKGQTIGIFAFNGPMGDGGPSAPGGYEPAILERYFSDVLSLPMPAITDVTIQGPGNDPGNGTNPNDASPEVYLDLSIVGSLATGANIVVYFTEFNEQGWVDALSEASTDTTHAPSVLSISYGNPESAPGSAWTAAAVRQVNLTLEAAAARGLTVTCATGDSGATDGLPGNKAHVDFPASSPWVLACGGTRLEAADGSIAREVVWNDQSPNPEADHGATGGGVSVVFGPPSWQTSAPVPPVVGTAHRGRGIPDVSSLADPETPFVVAQPGPHGLGGVGGTSAAAPLWASLLVRCNAALGKPVGFLNPTLYQLPPDTLHDITEGNNRMPPDGVGYDASPGWDACTGLGSPGGSALLAELEPSAASSHQPASA